MEQALVRKRHYFAGFVALAVAGALFAAAPPALAGHGNTYSAAISPTQVASDVVQPVAFTLTFRNDVGSADRIDELVATFPAGFEPDPTSFDADPDQPTTGFTPPCQSNQAWNVDFDASTGVIKVKPPAEPHRLCPGGSVEISFEANLTVPGGPYELETKALRVGVEFHRDGAEPVVTVTAPGTGNGPGNGNDDDDNDVDDDDDEVQPGDPIVRHDVCPEGEVPPAGFVDVTSGNVHAFAIDCIAFWGITLGVTADTYGPALNTTRGHMASFLGRTIETAGVTLSSPPDDWFTDIADNVHRDNINKLAAVGIVAGVGDGRYDPNAPVRRDQMASMLVRTYEFVTGESVDVFLDYFTDDDGNPHEDNINKAAELGLTVGVTPTTYEPASLVRRDQMASFLMRLLELIFQG